MIYPLAFVVVVLCVRALVTREPIPKDARFFVWFIAGTLALVGAALYFG